MSKVAVYSHSSALEHDSGPGHPERPERVEAVLRALSEGDMGDRLERLEAPAADRGVLDLAHDPDYLDALERLDAAGGGRVDLDTQMGPRSLEAARRASGAAVDAARRLLSGELAGAFVVMRPPGHHAPAAGPASAPRWTRTRPTMGFCLVDHAAVAARWAVREGGARRAAVVDWDAHHGNGTQDIFWTDPDVLYASVHQYPFYPGTGDVTERGEGAGLGTTLNVPLPAGTAEDAYMRAIREVVVPELERFGPDLVVVSAGFDAHLLDPVCMMRLTASAYHRITACLSGVAPQLLVLEGGYDLDALAYSARASAAALLGEDLPSELPEAELARVEGVPDALRWVDRALGLVRRG